MANGKKGALADYVQVNERIEKFWAKYPNGRISTSMISWENGIVIMRADVWKDRSHELADANGFAYEKEGSSFINNTSALENAETSAVGRALAILGFEIKKSIASREEVENAKLNQPATPEQIGIMKTLTKQIALARAVKDAEIYKHLKIEDITKLTGPTATKAIDTLKKWKEQAESK